jgi:hypothetical protein
MKRVRNGILAFLFLFGISYAGSFGLQRGDAAGIEYSLSIPLSTVITAASGSVTQLASRTVASENVGLVCGLQAIAKNQGSVHPNNDLIVRSGTSSVTIPNVERASGVNTEGNGTLTLGNTIVVELKMGPDRIFSAGLDVMLDCKEQQIQVCRDGKEITIYPSERRSTDTEAPCPDISVCREGKIITIKPSDRRSTDSNPPCEVDQIQVCRDGVIITIPKEERRSTDTNPPCDTDQIQVCRDGKIVTISETDRRSTDTDPPCPEETIQVCRDGILVTIRKSDRRTTDTDAPCPVQQIQVCRDGKIVTIASTDRRATDADLPCPNNSINVCRDGKLVAILPSDRRSTDTDAPCPTQTVKICRNGMLYTIEAGMRQPNDTEPQNGSCSTGVVASAHVIRTVAREGKPTALPATGAGSFAGIFVSTGILGSVGHHLYMRRRLR